MTAVAGDLPRCTCSERGIPTALPSFGLPFSALLPSIDLALGGRWRTDAGRRVRAAVLVVFSFSRRLFHLPTHTILSYLC